MPHQPIVGLFDSGFGGLTVLGPLVSRFPALDYRFVADAGRAPYGDRREDELRAFGSEIISFLKDQGMTHLIVACNTTCATVLPQLMPEIEVRVWGLIEAGAQAAVQTTRNKRIAVLATVATAGAKAYTAAINAIDPAVEVLEVACPALVPLIQADRMDSADCKASCGDYMTKVNDFGADTVILGCSHYPYLVPLLQTFSSRPLAWVDPAPALVDVVSQTFSPFKEPSGTPAPISFFVSGSLPSFTQFVTTHRLFSDHPYTVAPYSHS
ncbi:MAG: glutamate racemase [Candidatus Margulisiibacteriota bacterium]